ncbi:MAG TPA: hypothetical protein VGB89_09660 [Bacteroidota bacterium]
MVSVASRPHPGQESVALVPHPQQYRRLFTRINQQKGSITGTYIAFEAWSYDFLNKEATMKTVLVRSPFLPLAVSTILWLTQMVLNVVR